MNRFPSDYSVNRPSVCPDRHPLPDQLLRVPTADRLRINETVFIDLGNDQSDLIAMTCQHQPNIRVGVLAKDQVAVQIRFHRIGEASSVLSDDRLYWFFVARHARRIKQFFKKVN